MDSIKISTPGLRFTSFSIVSIYKSYKFLLNGRMLLWSTLIQTEIEYGALDGGSTVQFLKNSKISVSSSFVIIYINISYSQHCRLMIYFSQSEYFFCERSFDANKVLNIEAPKIAGLVVDRDRSHRSVLPSEFDVCRFTRVCGSSCPPGTMSSPHQLGWISISLSFFLLSQI